MTQPPIPPLDSVCWPIDPACLAASWDDYDSDVQARAIALATTSLYRLTLGRVGGCPVKVRPCATPPVRPFGTGFQYAYMYANGYPTSGAGMGLIPFGLEFSPGQVTGPGWPCGGVQCAPQCEVTPGGVVGRVDEILVDGAEVDLTNIRIDGFESIVWQSPDPCPWPVNQDVALPDTEPGTFSITYLAAYPVDGLGAWAAGTLAAEFAAACIGSGKCRLPKNVTTITRQGVSQTLVTESFPDGRTGIREVDAYIEAWVTKGMKTKPQVWSPDTPSFRVTP